MVCGVARVGALFGFLWDVGWMLTISDLSDLQFDAKWVSLGVFVCACIFFFWSFENMECCGNVKLCDVYRLFVWIQKCEIEREWRLGYMRVSRNPLQIRQKRKRSQRQSMMMEMRRERRGVEVKRGGGEVMVVMK